MNQCMSLFDGRPMSEKKFLLNSGFMLPAVGISTYRSRSERAVYNLVDRALACGYRHFDTSQLFCNEVALRHAFANLLPKYNLERTDIFISSKLIAIENGNLATIRGVLEQTLINLGIDFVDLFLISSTIETTINLKNAWELVQILHEEGYAASIGVANFNVHQLRDIIEESAIPSVNQLEWHPLRHSSELYQFCNDYNIKLQAYSPFGTPFANHKRLLENRIIKKLAAKYEVPVAQIILMWSLQQEVAVVPSTVNPAHMKQNIDFTLQLSPRDMLRISSLAPDPDDSDAEI